MCMSTAFSTYRAFATCLFLIIFSANATSDELPGGVTVGYTTEGHPFKGNLDAPIVLLEYSDYLCPFCARYFNSTSGELTDLYVKTGKLRMEFHDFPIPSLHPQAVKGHQAATCAGEQGAVQFWQFHDALFSRQGEWNRLPDPDDFLESVASDLDLDLAAYKDCRQAGKVDASVKKSMQDGEAKKFSGTPTFQILSSAKKKDIYTIVGARPVEYFVDYIEALLAGNQPPQEPETPKPELPDWAKPDALALDNERPGFTVSGNPSRGDAKAPLVIVEFTDYQCPACARHLANTQPSIDAELISTGKVRWVNKMLPLSEHAHAPAAAVAAECAGQQNRFSDMHHALFDKQDSWANQDIPDTTFLKMADALGLDMNPFSTCLGSRQALERVMRDMYDAADVTRSTPAFVILDGETGKSISGTQKPEQFVQAVLDQLNIVQAREAK